MNSDNINGQGTSEEINPALITINTTLTLLDGLQGANVVADFSYDPQQPFAVRLDLSMADSPPVTWEFSRDLLRSGMVFPVGIGDVRILPHPYGVIIELFDSAGVTKFFGFPEPIREFIRKSLDAVPDGAEDRFCSLDRELAALFERPLRSNETSDGAASEG